MTPRAAAPLHLPPGTPQPADGGAVWITASDGARLRAAVFRPPGPARGSVILGPGWSEPIEKYAEVIGDLQARGFAVLVHDWRGQGLSARWLADSPAKGHARGWRPFLDDWNRILGEFEAELPKPWIAVAHSMGGALTLLALTEGEHRIAAALLCAPMLSIRTGYPLWLARTVTALGRLAGADERYIRRRPSNYRAEAELLTRDPVRWARWRAVDAAAPDLSPDGLTWGWVAFAFGLTVRLADPRRLARVAIPVTIVGAGEDRICHSRAAERAARRMPQGRYVEVEGALHEIFLETDDRRAVAWREFDALVDRVAPALDG